MLKCSLLVIMLAIQGNGEECPLGKYGETCEEVCSPNCAPSLTDKSVYCHKLTGKCSEGCKRGWHGDRCNKKCSKNCLKGVCNVYNGACMECEVNYSGDYCETYTESGTKQETASTPLAAILVPVFIIIIIIIIITVTVYRRRRIRFRRYHYGRSKQATFGVMADGHDADSDLQTPDTDLIVACREGKLQRVRDILDQSLEDLNKKDCSGMTPVMWAARRGHREVLDLLVKKGADVSLQDKDCHNILHWACYGCNFAMVKYVLSLDKVDINNKGQDGRTPAMFAARQGYMKLFQLLVSKGGFPSEVDNEGNNVLLLACWGGNEEIVKYIISHKTVDINGTGQSGRTPLMSAAYWGNEKVVDLLVKKGACLTQLDAAGDNVLHMACLGGYVDIVKRVVDLVDINSPGQYNRTPMMMAARRGEKEIFDLLVKKEAASCVDDDGNNILHLASEGGHLEIVKYVLKKKDIQDINARNKHNETATMLAPRGSEVSHLLVSRYHGLMQ